MIDQAKVIQNHAQMPYHCTEVEVEAEEEAKGDAHGIVAADVDVGDKRLPTTAHGYPCL